MPGFADEDELNRYVGGIFEAAMADPETGPKLADTGLVLRMECTDPESNLTIDLPGKVVHQGLDGPEPGATMVMSTETANAYWQGKVNLPFAMARGKVKVKGEMSKLLALAPLSKKLFPTYVETLKRDGRDDLVVT
ncbi:SCP2 sterol-binding domain-containing protein [Actinomycetospora chibensis]|uniref:SCP2 sterol-binding domain-containing protein n=1 Tax=Actinomycetospora chibensis TaxID=663606 RepID=A0ABV9RIF6_9PSEU|nr:SCP2 sterol-binding domain-containing protein [Actinomycetospora chibensis]MDD7925051.1 SCP2 sterol-binding domain-containing protein [Actinomycetospora chibensis]